MNLFEIMLPFFLVFSPIILLTIIGFIIQITLDQIQIHKEKKWALTKHLVDLDSEIFEISQFNRTPYV